MRERGYQREVLEREGIRERYFRERGYQREVLEREGIREWCLRDSIRETY